jgi:putative transposase
MNGILYLAIVLDACSRKIVGWSMANHSRTELVLDALNMARDGYANVIHHSHFRASEVCRDRSEYTSLALGGRCLESGVCPSEDAVGDAYHKTISESFLTILQCEPLDRRRFASQAKVKMACFSFIEG